MKERKKKEPEKNEPREEGTEKKESAVKRSMEAYQKYFELLENPPKLPLDHKRKMTEKKGTPEMYRQGDLLLIPVSALPKPLCKPKPKICIKKQIDVEEEKEEEEEDPNVVLRAPKSREFHHITCAWEFRHQPKSKLGPIFLKVGSSAVISQFDHASIPLPKGFYRAVFYREYGTRRRPPRRKRYTRKVWSILMDRHPEMAHLYEHHTHKNKPYRMITYSRYKYFVWDVKEAYSQINLPPPKVLRFDTPLNAWIAADLLLHANSPRLQKDFGLLWGKDTERQIWNEINSQLDADLPAQITPINDLLRKWYWSEERFPTRRGLVKCLRARVRNLAESVRRERLTSMLQESAPSTCCLPDDVWDAILSQAVHTSGQSEAGAGVDFSKSFRPGFNIPPEYDFRWLHMDKLAAFGVDQTYKGEGWPLDIKVEFGPWWPFDKVVVLCNSATSIELNSDDELHNKYGPALEYGAELKIWALNGITYSIKKGEADVLVNLDAIHSEKNAKRRRFLKKIYGEERFLIDSGAEIIDNNRFGVLYRLSRDNREPYVVLKFPKGRPGEFGGPTDYFVRVPPEMTRSREAIAWSFGLSEMAYNPVFET